MLRFFTVIWLFFALGRAHAGVSVELDVVFNDTTIRRPSMYVLVPNAYGTNDTLAAFDSLSFYGLNRVSLFYTARSNQRNILSMVDSSGVYMESKPFRVSPQRANFKVMVGQQHIKVSNKDFLYPQKNDDQRSYFAFLTIFLAIKILITAGFVFSSKQRKRIVIIALTVFLVSAFMDWFLPINYVYRLLTMMLSEFLLIALVARKSILWRQAALLVLTVNSLGFGLIAILYLWFVFW